MINITEKGAIHLRNIVKNSIIIIKRNLSKLYSNYHIAKLNQNKIGCKLYKYEIL